MTAQEETGDFERLHALIATADIKGFLDGMSGHAAATMSKATGGRIESAVTLRRRKRSTTIAGSSDEAILLDGIEQRLGDGPCAEALRTGKPTLIADVSAERRWPVYCENLAASGYRSVLGVPLQLEEGASGALNFFAPAPGVFTTETTAEAALFAGTASHALRLAIRIAVAEELADNLRAALDSRTAIDLACGMIMAQNECSKEQAIEILRRTSSNRNQKLNTLAEQIVTRVAGTDSTTTYFED
ncbi:GAF and ANTAR domain-containing protein [Arthrobacter sp. FW306-05-C]|uniref:GAF and ANTAR domain-containing protein n=1 Tax=unclassified Arthrobacter TaxID=235627 RepID=UPI001F272C53|nr:GAF and ANTAR domain-containing protein [Arthrobacter sp. FW306-05-C]UKA66111.1 GAF and ANTAR domain-containing protein [Arthrobacter sp. FW306-05-C]